MARKVFYTPEFLAFCEAYPKSRRKQKYETFLEWLKIDFSVTSIEVILAAVKAQSRSSGLLDCSGPYGSRLVPGMFSWLRAECWNRQYD